ncbi:hypothetical protein HN51_24125 [Ectopseudomonas mendocina]|nr:hypothetical protein HN51_24125 [Pseudomonas mendocina]
MPAARPSHGRNRRPVPATVPASAPRLHADQVANVTCQALVQLDQEVDAGQRLAGNTGQVPGEQWGGRQLDQIRSQLALLALGVGEGNALGVRLEEEVEGVEHRHFGDQIHLDLELAGLLREHQTCQVVALRVLLPVDEMFARLDLQCVGENARTAVRRRRRRTTCAQG